MSASSPRQRPRRSRRRDARPAAQRGGGTETAVASPTAAGHWLYGRHAVRAALANPKRRWHQLVALPGQAAEAHALATAARAVRRGEGEPVRLLDRAGFDALVGGEAVHQGLALDAEPLAEPDLDAVLRAAAPAAIVIALDRVSDPHNIGAVLRSAAAFGAVAVILARDGAPAARGALAKAASGALEIVPLLRVVNLARALDRLKAAGFWICGLEEDAPRMLAGLDLGPRAALVLGAEGTGLRRLVRERCDYLARLPTSPAQPSLNVSNAAAIALYELAAHRTTG